MATTTQRRPVKTVALGNSLLPLAAVINTIVTFALLIVDDAIAIYFTVGEPLTAVEEAVRILGIGCPLLIWTMRQSTSLIRVWYLVWRIRFSCKD